MIDEDEGLPDSDEQPETDERNVVDAATRRGVAKAAKESRRKLSRAHEFWKSCLADEVGRAEIWGLLQAASAFELRIGVGPNGFPSPEQSWINAGLHDFGQRFYQTLLVIDIDGVKRMHDDHDPRFKIGK